MHKKYGDIMLREVKIGFFLEKVFFLLNFSKFQLKVCSDK